MVNDPVVAIFAPILPMMVPARALVTTADIAGPDVSLPPASLPTCMKNSVPPDTCRTAPNKTNKNMKLADRVNSS